VRNWLIYDDLAAWQAGVLACLSDAARAAIAERGVFHIVLAGGETPGRVYAALARTAQDWPAWQVWFGDERCLAAEDPGRNSRMAADRWLDAVGIPGTNIHTIDAELGAVRAAEGYAERLAAVDRFDLVLLGLGEDGHTASLFPGHEWGESESAPAALAVRDAPKPPPERVSLSAWRLARARRVLFLVTGAGKRAALAAWRRGARLPAAAIRPPGGVEVLATRDALAPESEANQHDGPSGPQGA